MGPWSRLLRDDPVRLKIELAKAGTTLGDLARDIRDVPEMSELTEKMLRPEKQRLALEYFGDQGHPQPEDRRNWVSGTSPARTHWRKTPEFRRLPQLPDDDRSVGDADGAELEEAGTELPLELPRLPGGSTLALYRHGKLQGAVKRFDKGATVGDVSATLGLPQDDARRVRLMFERGLRRLVGGKLVPHARVGMKGARYALRYLSDDGARWLDPNRELVGR